MAAGTRSGSRSGSRPFASARRPSVQAERSRAKRGGVEARAELRSGRTGRSGERSNPPLRLWAPWRLEFIEAPKPAGCIFCQFPSEEGEANDRKNLVVHRSAHSFAVLNRYPYNPGHLMVVPYRHIPDYTDLSPDELAEFSEFTRRAMTVIRSVSAPHGFNLGINAGSAAGAGIAAHLHQHVVPRWGGDSNFMPVVGLTKVLPQLLADTRRLLSQAWG